MIDKAKCIDIYLKQQDKNLKEATIKGKLKVILNTHNQQVTI